MKTRSTRQARDAAARSRKRPERAIPVKVRAGAPQRNGDLFSRGAHAVIRAEEAVVNTAAQFGLTAIHAFHTVFRVAFLAGNQIYAGINKPPAPSSKAPPGRKRMEAARLNAA